MAATRRPVRSGRAMTAPCRAVRALRRVNDELVRAPEAIVCLARAPRARQGIAGQTPVDGVFICHIRRPPGHAMRYHRDLTGAAGTLRPYGGRPQPGGTSSAPRSGRAGPTMTIPVRVKGDLKCLLSAVSSRA